MMSNSIINVTWMVVAAIITSSNNHIAVAMTPCPAGGFTECPVTTTCCKMNPPDPARVPGDYGCMPAGTSGYRGCSGGGTYPTGCCCAPGPSNISTHLPNVLIIGDSVSAGYTPFVAANLSGVAQVNHGPDNAGGGNADGSHYGQLCMPYFIATPKQEVVNWDVITFNFGLHDSQTNVTDYIMSLTNITQTLQEKAPSASLLYFLTTVPAMSTPGNDADKIIIRLNAAATTVMRQLNVPIVDLHATMMECGSTCTTCDPHCQPAGYEYLVNNAIAPAIRNALKSRTVE